MKKLFFILFICWQVISLSAQSTYYVSTNGSDSGTGSISDPWLTWEKAFNSTSVSAGDTVYFRGGVYYLESDEAYGPYVTRSGTSGNYVHFMNYPGEVPILDGANVTVDLHDNRYGILVVDVDYIYFRGLTVRNIEQIDGYTDTPVGWYINTTTNLIFDKCVADNCWGIGFKNMHTNNNQFINCDAYNCVDWITAIPTDNPAPGNDGSGFQDYNTTSTSYVTYFEGCRAWGCGDQGFSSGSIGQSVYDNCWSWDNGRLEGGGHGFKMGWISTIDEGVTNRIYRNCIALYNVNRGWDSNDQGYDCGSFEVYNNTAYGNLEGFRIFDTEDTDAHEYRRIYRNNVAYNNNSNAAVSSGAVYTHSNNSWDTGVTVSAADFVTVDTTGIGGARQADGSLPDLNFFKLVEGSDLIDAGIDVGLTYTGTAPDLGYDEYEAIVGEYPTVSFIATPTTINEGESVSFDASASTDDGTITSYAWTFGDGGSATGVTTSHTYNSDGSYTAVLTLTDDDSNIAASSTTITVNAVIPADNGDSILITSSAMLLDSIANNRQPGDTLWLKADSFTGDINFNCDGGSSQPIIVRSHPDNTPVFSGAVTASGDHVHFRGCTFSGSVSITGDNTQIDSCTLNSTLNLNACTNPVITNNTFTSSGTIYSFTFPNSDSKGRNWTIDYNTYNIAPGTLFNGMNRSEWRMHYDKFDQNSVFNVNQ